MADADDLVAVDVFNGRCDLLTRPSECGCGRCEAAAIARVGDVWTIRLRLAKGGSRHQDNAQQGFATHQMTRYDRPAPLIR
jgi:hypothetical protein